MTIPGQPDKLQIQQSKHLFVQNKAPILKKAPRVLISYKKATFTLPLRFLVWENYQFGFKNIANLGPITKSSRFFLIPSRKNELFYFLSSQSRMISRGGLFCSSRNAKFYKISHPLQSKASQNKPWDIVLSLERLRDMYRKLAKSELLVKDLYMENSRLIRAIKVHFKLEKSEVADVPKVLPNWLFLYFMNVHDISFSTWFFRYFEKKNRELFKSSALRHTSNFRTHLFQIFEFKKFL